MLYLNFEGEILFEILHNEDQERESHSKTLVRTDWAAYVGGGNIVPNYLQCYRPNTRISDSFDVSIHCLTSFNKLLFD